MKIKSRKLYMQIGAMVLAMTFGLSAYAETPREELVHAYRLLQTANHDYAGHRVAAMSEVQAATRELGLEVKGDIESHEREWKSDQQLTEARRLLRDSRDKLEKRDRERTAEHVDRAMKEIDAALIAKR
jgi:hypothetical protein